MKKATRDRSVQLDLRKVRMLASQQGLKNFGVFEAAFLHQQNLPADSNNTSPRLAWHGKKLDKRRATEIALFLGERSYVSLLPSPPPNLHYPELREWDQHYSPPGALLKAEYGIVPFHQREAELEDLQQWCQNPERLSIRLYTGAGGMGKTRLAIELCHRLGQEQQWASGFLLQQPANHTGDSFSWLGTETRPVLIVIDYAETRRKELVACLKSALNTQNHIRIILLARAAANWWGQLKTEHQGVGDLLMSKASQWLYLQPLLTNQQQRKTSWLLAADSFAKHLQRTPVINLPEDLSSQHFERVLILHMQALIAIEGEQAATSLQGILSVILNRERHFWEEQLKASSLPQQLLPAIGTAMARITLMGGAQTPADATQVLQDLPILRGCKAYELQAITDLLHALYPSDSNNGSLPNNHIAPLQPDLLGEHLLQEELKQNEALILGFVFA